MDCGNKKIVSSAWMANPGKRRRNQAWLPGGLHHSDGGWNFCREMQLEIFTSSPALFSSAALFFA